MAEEDAIRRVMPHSIEAEQSVIGAMLMDAEAIEAASEMLKEEDFYARQYGVLFTAILEMHRNGIAVDPVRSAPGTDRAGAHFRQYQILCEDRLRKIAAAQNDPRQ